MRTPQRMPAARLRYSGYRGFSLLSPQFGSATTTGTGIGQRWMKSTSPFLCCPRLSFSPILLAHHCTKGNPQLPRALLSTSYVTTFVCEKAGNESFFVKSGERAKIRRNKRGVAWIYSVATRDFSKFSNKKQSVLCFCYIQSFLIKISEIQKPARVGKKKERKIFFLIQSGVYVLGTGRRIKSVR